MKYLSLLALAFILFTPLAEAKRYEDLGNYDIIRRYNAGTIQDEIKWMYFNLKTGPTKLQNQYQYAEHRRAALEAVQKLYAYAMCQKGKKNFCFKGFTYRNKL